MALSTGMRLGPYEIDSPLGRGGMGEVYRAKDTRLGRSVAIKVLPDQLCKDASALARFQREARALAALSHPNILAIFDVGVEKGISFVVMELLSGQTLRSRISQNRLPWPQAVQMGIEIAEGISAAHSRGIIHRDLKPENIFLTGDGRIKILDFGLAFWRPDTMEAPAGLEATVTLATAVGVVMGTTAYMSPEQLTAAQVDARSDIFSFGCMLQEMITGSRPFARATSVETIASILKEDPPSLTQFDSAIPIELDQTVKRCLKKEPDQRFQSAGDLAFHLRQILSSTSATKTAVRPIETTVTSKRGHLKGLAVATVLLFVGAAALLLSKSEWFSFSRGVESNLLPPHVVPFVALSLSDRAEQPAFSPDGNQVAFVRRSDSPGVSGIYITQIGTNQLLQLTKNEHEQDYFCCPAWSPDGRYIAFSRYPHNGQTVQQTINIVSAIGGAERKLLSQTPAHPPLDWSPDGKFIVFTTKDVDKETYSLSLLSIETLETRKLSNPSAGYQDWGPAFSPDGTQLALIRANGEVGDIFIMAANGGEPRRLTFDHAKIPSPPAWARDGKSIVFSSTRTSIPTLWRIPLSGGAPVQVPQVGVVTLHPSIAPRGYRLAYEYLTGASSLWLVEQTKVDGKNSRTKVTASKGNNQAPELSPDGKQIVFESDRLGSMEIWTCNRDGSNLNQLTHLGGGPQAPGPPRWSPDSQRIAFDSALGEHNAIFIMNSEGGLPRPLTHESVDIGNPTWSRDGKWIYFSSIRTGEWQIWRMPSVGGDPVQLTKHGGQLAFESADRRFIYYAKTPGVSIWRMGVDGGEEAPLTPQVHPRTLGDWALVNRGIFFLADEPSQSVMRFFDFATSRVKDVVILEQPVTTKSWISASADGRFVLYRQNDQEEDNILMLENFR